MRANTVRDLGAMVRSSRRAHGMTQADLASRLRVSREWVVRLEGGHPRLEAQKVLDALTVLGLTFDVEQQQFMSVPAKAPAKKAPAKKAPAKKAPARKATGQIGQTKWVSTAMAKRAPAKKDPVKRAATAKPASRAADPFDALFRQRRR